MSVFRAILALYLWLPSKLQGVHDGCPECRNVAGCLARCPACADAEPTTRYHVVIAGSNQYLDK